MNDKRITEIDPILLNEWHIIAKVADIKQGTITPARLLGENIIIWRGDSPDSPILVWQDWCPHRGVALSHGKILGDRLACRYHGWQYDKTANCVAVPSLEVQPPSPIACVKTYRSQASNGYLWVSLGNPVHDAPSFPEWDNPDHHLFMCNPYSIKASPFRVMENNIDQSHIAFLHEGTLGDSNHSVIEDYKVKIEKDSVVIQNLSSWQLDGAYTDANAVSKITISLMTIERPLGLKAVKEIENGSKIMYWFVNATPVDEENCLLWMSLAANYGHEIIDSEMQAVTDRVFLEDTLILESHRPSSLPISAGKDDNQNQWPLEAHAPCDRASIVYRHWLRNLGVTFGVC